MAEKKVGVVTHYFTHLHVAAVKLTEGPLRVGDKIHVRGHTSDFVEDVTSIQIEHEEVEQAETGSEIGLKVIEHAREHDEIFVVTED